MKLDWSETDLNDVSTEQLIELLRKQDENVPWTGSNGLMAQAARRLELLTKALKYAHSQMQPFCDDTIVKQALEKAGVA